MRFFRRRARRQREPDEPHTAIGPPEKPSEDDPEVLAREVDAARNIHRVLTYRAYIGRITESELWSTLLDQQDFVRIPLSSEDLDPASSIVRLYATVAKQANDPVLVAEMQRLRADVIALLAAAGISVDPNGSVHEGLLTDLPVPRSRALHEQPLGLEDAQAVAPAAEQTLENSLARLFLLLGPPPEPTELDYTPAGHGGGGAQQ